MSLLTMNFDQLNDLGEKIKQKARETNHVDSFPLCVRLETGAGYEK